MCIGDICWLEHYCHKQFLFQQVLFSRSGATGSPKVMGTTQRKVTGWCCASHLFLDTEVSFPGTLKRWDLWKGVFISKFPGANSLSLGWDHRLTMKFGHDCGTPNFFGTTTKKSASIGVITGSTPGNKKETTKGNGNQDSGFGTTSTNRLKRCLFKIRHDGRILIQNCGFSLCYFTRN